MSCNWYQNFPKFKFLSYIYISQSHFATEKSFFTEFWHWKVTRLLVIWLCQLVQHHLLTCYWLESLFTHCTLHWTLVHSDPPSLNIYNLLYWKNVFISILSLLKLTKVQLINIFVTPLNFSYNFIPGLFFSFIEYLFFWQLALYYLLDQ